MVPILCESVEGAGHIVTWMSHQPMSSYIHPPLYSEQLQTYRSLPSTTHLAILPCTTLYPELLGSRDALSHCQLYSWPELSPR